MNDQNLDGRLTIIAGRPSSGKTTTAMRIAKAYLRNRTNVLFCHAEGPLLLQDTLFEFSGPDDLTFLDYIPDIFMNESDLLVKIGILSPKQESLVVIDTIELFDCEPNEFTKALRNATAKTQTKIVSSD